jgi:hypothetical protein
MNSVYTSRGKFPIGRLTLSRSVPRPKGDLYGGEYLVGDDGYISVDILEDSHDTLVRGTFDTLVPKVLRTFEVLFWDIPK